MRKLMIAAASASTALATPALARDGTPYVGIDAGLMQVDTFDLRYINSAMSVNDGIRLRHKLGYDLDGVIGYDFGMFRLEGELGYKHARIKNADLDPAALAAVLLPSTLTHRYADGHGNIVTAMVDALVDFGPSDSWNGSVGIGAGEARARYYAGLTPSNALNFTSQDSAFAWQLIGEVRAPVSRNVELGLKYRYFQTAKFDFGPFCQTTCTTALPYRLHGRLRTNSLLASLIYNFGGVVLPAPPPPAPPPPPPPPANQTCPDGSVIPASATCPPPSAPPPPPPPPEQSGERGN